MVWTIVYAVEAGGWCVANTKTGDVVAGPYGTHEEAVQAVQTMAYRIAQGWTP